MGLFKPVPVALTQNEIATGQLDCNLTDSKAYGLKRLQIIWDTLCSKDKAINIKVINHSRIVAMQFLLILCNM